MEDRDCVICGESVKKKRGTVSSFITCSSQCAEDYGVVRNILDQEKYEAHAHARAKTVLRDPKNYSEEMVRWAKRMEAGEIKPDVNNIQLRKGSKRYEVAKRLGIV